MAAGTAGGRQSPVPDTPGESPPRWRAGARPLVRSSATSVDRVPVLVVRLAVQLAVPVQVVAELVTLALVLRGVGAAGRRAVGVVGAVGEPADQGDGDD